MQLLIENAEQVEQIQLRTGLLSEDQFWDLCAKYPDYEIEVSAEGEATIMAPANAWTGHRNARLTWQLFTWADADERGVAFDSSSMFTLPNGAILSPDASWIHSSRIPAKKDKMWAVCPDFVIELRLHSDRVVNLRAKMHEWIQNGAQLGWLVDPKKKTVTIFRSGREPEELIEPDYVIGEGPVEGFRLELTKIWNS